MSLWFKIKAHYTNKYGFFTYHPAKKSNPDIGIWDSDNPHLSTGQINLLLRFQGFYNDTFKKTQSETIQYENLQKTIQATEVSYGLHARHAPVDLYLDSAKYDAISLDEHDGICFSSVALGASSMYSLLSLVKNIIGTLMKRILITHRFLKL